MSVKKLLSVLFSASIISLSTMAQNGDNAITPIEPSLNTDGDTYIIESAENMHWINENWKTIADKKFKIIDNRTINLDSWFSNIALTTEFDGNGATIKFNSTGTSDDYVTVTPTGLFEKIIEGATVSNLNIVGEIYNPSSDGDDLGILCNCLIIDDENTSPVTLRNITTDGSIKTRGMNAGGIAGSTTASVYMQNIINKASIEASCYVGGILGQVNKYAQSVELNSVANIGLLKMTDPLFNIPNIYPAIGGIIGFIEQYINEESSPVMLTDISSRGSIIVTSTKDVDITSMDNSVCIFVGNTGRGITFKNICAIFYGQIDNGNGEIIEAGLYSFEKRVHFEYGCPWVGWGESEPGIIYEGKNYSYYTDENGNIVSGCNPLEDFQNCQITYFLNNELEEEKSSWRQSPDGYPILAIEGGGDLVYKHGNTYNTMPHAYNEEGYCQGGEGCYEHPNFTNDGIIISNAGQLRWLNENFYSEEMSNYRYSNIHFGAVFIAPRSTSNQGPNLIPVTIDLTNGDPNNNNWISNINVYANVYGHGSTINFVSCSYDPKTPVTGLFNMIGGEYEQSEQYSELTINDLNIYGTIYSNNQLGDPVGNYIGLLANAARCNINTRIENIKLYNYIDESIDAPSGISTSIPAQGSLIGEACGSQCTVYLSNIVSEVNINGSMRMGGLLGSGQNVNISYSTYKGTMNYSSDLIFEGWQGEYSMGGLIGYASGNININYCYTSAPMYNYERDDVYMGTYIGTRDKYDENDQTTLEFCYAYYVNEELEPTNYSYLAVNPIGYIKETEAPYILNSEKVTRPQSEREAENIVTYNYDNGIFHYFPSIDKYQKNVVLNYFNRGEVLGVIINNGGAGEDSRDMFSQNLGEIIPEEFESCPRLVFELGTNEDIYPVFNTCSKEPIYSNTDRRRKNEETGGFILDENKQYVYDHVFNPKTHLCIYCNAIDEDYFADNSEVIIE
ncbi:MAG: hypothetical protein Q4C30_09645, partial [Bacteroidia bacterium]|nr:hypothetical protein [Bacteroidia bacterium]